MTDQISEFRGKTCYSRVFQKPTMFLTENSISKGKAPNKKATLAVNNILIHFFFTWSHENFQISKWGRGPKKVWEPLV
jgi:hypothetical protein